MWLGDAEQIEVYAVVPKDAGKDFAANIVTLGTAARFSAFRPERPAEPGLPKWTRKRQTDVRAFLASRQGRDPYVDGPPDIRRA